MTNEELIKKAAEWLYLNLNMSEANKQWWVNDFVEYMQQVVSDEEVYSMLRTEFPLELFTEFERSEAQRLGKENLVSGIKYLRDRRPELGLKGCKTYWDTYLAKRK